MDKFEHLKRSLQDYLGDSPKGDACLAVLAALEKRKTENLKMLTYTSLSKDAKRDASDPFFILSVLFFTTSDKFHLLDQRYIFYDQELNEEIDVTKNDVLEAKATGTLPNGLNVSDVDAHFYPYFTASPALLELKGN